MAAQARVLRVTTGGESPVIITARACLAPPRLLAQALSGRPEVLLVTPREGQAAMN
jgi:hypothetical protein